MKAPALRFLADESCDFAVVRALRSQGYDVVAIGEHIQRSVDAEVLRQATRERRLLLTEDKDFGWLVFASNAGSAGVVLVRFPGNAREGLAKAVTQLVSEHGTALLGCFTVVQPGYIRIARKTVPPD